MNFRSLIWFLLPLFLVLGSSSAPAVDVAPGEPASFDVNVLSSEVRAGEPFRVRIVVRDGQGNRVQDYSEYDREVLIQSEGPGQVEPATISAGDFEDAELTRRLSVDTSGSTRIQVRETDHLAQGTSSSFSVSPGDPQQMSLEPSESARVGEPFALLVEVRDEQGNLVTDLHQREGELLLSADGSLDPVPREIPLKVFEDGTARLSIQYDAAEKIQITGDLTAYDLQETASPLQVLPGSTARIDLSGPSEVRAGEPIELLLEALDSEGNVVDDFQTNTRTVELFKKNGDTKPLTYFPEDKFQDGVTTGEVRLESAGRHQIWAHDSLTRSRSDELSVRVRPGSLDRVEATVPRSAQAGESFPITIRGYDQFGNRRARITEEDLPITIRRGGEILATIRSPVSFPHRETVTIRESGFQAVTVQQEGDTLGTSERFEIQPAAPSRLTANVPEKVQAGEPFDVTVRLEDRFGNRILSNEGTQSLQASLLGEGISSTHSISSDQFHLGQTDVTFQETTSGTAYVEFEHPQYDIRSTTREFQIVPGEYDRLRLTTPDVVQADEEFLLEVEYLDAYGNVLQSVPDEFERLNLDSTGLSAIEPASVPGSELTAPVTEIPVRYNRAEEIIVQATDHRGQSIQAENQVRVAPGELAQIDVQAARRVNAGESFPVRLVPRDQHGNRLEVEDLPSDLELNVTIQDSSRQLATVTSDEFEQDGSATPSLRLTDSGEQVLEIRGYGLREQSRPVEVLPGRPSDFDLTTEGSVRSGRPFEVEIQMRDSHGNSINRLPEDFHGVRLESAGDRELYPRRLERSLFDQDGTASAYLTYDGTGELNVDVSALSEPVETTMVGPYSLERAVRSARVHLVSSGSVDYEVEESDQSRRVIVKGFSAQFDGNEREQSFDGWFLEYLGQQQLHEDPLPVVELSLQSGEEINVQQQANSNLLTLEVGTGSPGGGSFDRALELMDKENYEGALDEINQYLEEFPEDEDAQRLKRRLERLVDVTS